MTDSPIRFVDTKRAAEILGVSKSYLDHARIAGGGPKYRKFGRVVRYAVSDLTDWANQQARVSTSPVAK